MSKLNTVECTLFLGPLNVSASGQTYPISKYIGENHSLKYVHTNSLMYICTVLKLVLCSVYMLYLCMDVCCGILSVIRHCLDSKSWKQHYCFCREYHWWRWLNCKTNIYRALLYICVTLRELILQFALQGAINMFCLKYQYAVVG